MKCSKCNEEIKVINAIYSPKRESRYCKGKILGAIMDLVIKCGCGTFTGTVHKEEL